MTCSCIGGVAYFGVGPVDFGTEARNADKAAADYRAAGLPWEAKDLAPNPPVKPEDNAATLIIRASKLPGDGLDSNLFDLVAAADKGQWEKVDAGLKNHADLLSLAEQAAEKPRVDFGRDYDLGANLLFPEYAACKRCVRILSIRAQWRAAKHDVKGAIEDLSHGFRIASVLKDEPLIIGMLVSVADQAITLSAVRKCAALLKDDPSTLSQIGQIIARESHTPDFEKSLRGEMYMGLAMLRNVDQYGGAMNLLKSFGNDGSSKQNSVPPLDPAKLVRTGLPTSTIARALIARHMEVWTNAKRKMDLHPGDPEGVARELDAINKDIDDHPTASNMFLLVIFPVFSQVGSAIVRDVADTRVTEALVAALIYRSKHGAFPNKIEDLPGKWIDPFDATPLRIARIGDSFRIYSVGPNKKDEGGQYRKETGHQFDDIIAAYPPHKPTPSLSKTQSPPNAKGR